MMGRIRMDNRLLQRIEEGRLKPPSKLLSKADCYNRAAAELGLTFERAVAEGKLLTIAAMADAALAATESPGAAATE
jgi:hypothetical protein